MALEITMFHTSPTIQRQHTIFFKVGFIYKRLFISSIMLYEHKECTVLIKPLQVFYRRPIELYRKYTSYEYHVNTVLRETDSTSEGAALRSAQVFVKPALSAHEIAPT